MTKEQETIAGLRVAAPCPTSWDGMTGDERVRHCTLCSLNVYNFAEMTGDEVRNLIARTEGRVCARLYRRSDGTVLTRDCPTGLRALRRRASRVAAALITALLSLPSLAFGGMTHKKPRLKTHGSPVALKVERVAHPQPAVLSGVVRDEAGMPIPGVSVAVRDESSECVITAVTDGKGAFHFFVLSDGLYRVDVALDGFESASMEHLRLTGSEVTHANVTLRLGFSVTVGILVSDPMMLNQGVPGSTTFSQEFINKLPL